MKKKYGFSILIILLAVSLIAVGCGNSDQGFNAGDSAEKTFKVGILLPGNINDKGWNASAYEGLQMAQDELGVEVGYMESVSQSDMEEGFRNYATQGYDLVLGHGYQFTDAAKKVAAEFPDAKFGILNGSASSEPNLASLQFTNWQPGYITGVLAGLITESNQIGAIGAEDTPVISDALNGFAAGVKLVNSDAEVTISYVGTWDDVAKGKETALAMIEKGADVVVCDANAVGLGAIEAAKEKGTYHIGFVDDQYDVAPEVVVASAIQSNQIMVVTAVKKALQEEWEPTIYTLGMKEGAEGISSLHDWEQKLPQEVIDQVRQVEQDLINGKIQWEK